MALAESSLASVPWAEIAPLALAFIVGAVLLIAGRRVMRLAFTAVGFLAGAAAGWILVQSFELPVSDWIVIGGLALVVAVFAALAYKITTAVVMAVVLGIAAPLTLITAGEVGLYEMPSFDELSEDAGADRDASTGSESEGDLPAEWLDLNLPPDVQEWLKEIAREKTQEQLDEALNSFLSTGKTPDEPLDDAAGSGDDGGDAKGDELAMSLSPSAQEHVDRAKAFVQDVYANAKQRWDAYPPSLRNNLMLSAAIGALLGLLLGALATGFSASIASSCAGSAVCLITASLGVAKLGGSESEWMPSSPSMWLALWFVVAIIGLTIQWTTRPKSVDTPG